MKPIYLPEYEGAVASGGQVPVVLDDTLEVALVRQLCFIVASDPLIHGTLNINSVKFGCSVLNSNK